MTRHGHPIVPTFWAFEGMTYAGILKSSRKTCCGNLLDSRESYAIGGTDYEVATGDYVDNNPPLWLNLLRVFYSFLLVFRHGYKTKKNSQPSTSAGKFTYSIWKSLQIFDILID